MFVFKNIFFLFSDSNKSLCLMQEQQQDYGDDYSFAANANDNTEILANKNDDSTSLMHSHNATATVSKYRFGKSSRSGRFQPMVDERQ